MCYEFDEQPYIIPLEQHQTQAGVLLLTYSFLLGKVTEKRQGEHISSRGFFWPIGRNVSDSNAIVGDHDRALHFAPSPDCASELIGEYGSHLLGVLPAPAIWDPVKKQQKTERCWHSPGAHTLFCFSCENYQLDVLTDSDFWRDLSKQSRRSSRGKDLSSLIPSVWHQQVELSV
jgi:hypothetical protein